MEDITNSKNIKKKFEKLMVEILKLKNQVTKLMVSNAINAAELKMTYTPEFIDNLGDAEGTRVLQKNGGSSD